MANPDDSNTLVSKSPNEFLPTSATPDRILAWCGYLLVAFSVVCFGAIVYLQVHESIHPTDHKSVFDFFQHESPTLILLLIGCVTASMGKRLITTVRVTETQTIPVHDLPLVQEAVIKGNSEPIDQYLRLRSLSGFAGNFTKLQVTGLPLTTVFLTLVFSAIALLPLTTASQFLDLAKLTLGAFIGSFVQGRVEQRKQQQAEASGKSSAGLPPA
jgi:hypothetical protein